MGRRTVHECVCTNPHCEVVLASAAEQLQDLGRDLAAGTADKDLVAGLIEVATRREEYRKALKHYEATDHEGGYERVMKQAMERARKVLEHAATEFALKHIDSILDEGALERGEASGLLDEGRTYGDPYDCYPPEWVHEPTCHECGEEVEGG